MSIDWSNAPEGATHYSPIACMFYKFSGAGDGEYWSKQRAAYIPASNRSEYGDEFIERPQHPQAWSGEGLPPVGTVCEYLEDGNGDWRRVRIVAIDNQLGYSFAVYSGDKGYSADRRTELFRPIRTPEQIAAEERANAIEEIAAVTGLRAGGGRIEVATAIYDAGYRKQVKP